MELDVKEYSVYRSTHAARKHEEMVIDISSLGTPESFLDFMPNKNNLSMVDDLYIRERKEQIWSAENMGNTALINQLGTEANLHALSQAYAMQVPLPYVYTMWWPWLKSYSGEFSVGSYDKWGFGIYPWIDQDLKQSMGH